MYELDNILMKITLKYAVILRLEMKKNEDLIRTETKLVKQQTKQSNFTKEMKMLAEYLELETKSNITLSLLSKDSDQYKRCKNAVKDNISAIFVMNNKYKGLRILNVYQIKNELLAKQLQVRK